MEAECNAVAMGRKRKEEIMQPILAKMRECFERVSAEAHKLDTAVARHFTRMGMSNNNSTVIAPNFSFCGGCNGMTVLKELRGGGNQNHRNNSNNNQRTKPQILHCSTCSTGMRLPKGVPTPLMKTQPNTQPQKCPICNYQVIKMNQGNGYNGNGYQLCPKCFSDAPAEYGGTATSGEFRCFNCTHPTCSLATGTRGGDVDIFPCPFCAAGGSDGKIYLKKNSKSYALSCSNYSATANRARCEYTIWLPREANSIATAEISSNNNNNNSGSQQTGYVTCSRCSTPNKTVRKLLFNFKPNSIPPGIPRNLIACVLCDEILKSDFNLSIPQLNQVQFRARSNTSTGGRGGNNRGYRGNTSNGVRFQNNSFSSRQRIFPNSSGYANNINNNNNNNSFNGRGGFRSNNEVRCYKCGQMGHYSNNCNM